MSITPGIWEPEHSSPCSVSSFSNLNLLQSEAGVLLFRSYSFLELADQAGVSLFIDRSKAGTPLAPQVSSPLQFPPEFLTPHAAAVIFHIELGVPL